MAKEFVPTQNINRNAKYISKEMMLHAMKMTLSARAAARFLHVSYNHYKKYAKLYKDEETGKTLLEVQKNPSGKGIPKYIVNPLEPGDKIPIMELIEGRVPTVHFDPRKIKARIIRENLIEESCSKCGFMERRVVDNKVPLILNHKDGNNLNFHLDNIEFLCYNCSFLYAKSPITDLQVEAMEDNVGRKIPTFDWELDDFQKEHLRSLGLIDEKEDNYGQELISKNFRGRPGRGKTKPKVGTSK